MLNIVKKIPGKTLFILWISLLPLFSTSLGYEGSKILLFYTGGFFLALLVLIKRVDFKLDTSDYWYIIWLVILFLASIKGVHPVESILGGSYRHQGVLFFINLLLVRKTLGLLTTKNKNLLWKVFLILGFGESLLVVFQKLFSFDFLNGRSVGTMGEPNAQAGLLVMLMAMIVLGRERIKISNKVFSAFLAATFVGILATASRTGLVVFFVVIVAYLVNNRLSFFGLKNLNLIKLILVGVALLATGIVVRNAFLTRKRPYLEVFEDRKTYLLLGWEKVRERPILGYGAESGEVVYKAAFKKTTGIELEDLIVDRSHNLILDIMIWSGFAGVVVFLGWLVSRVRTIIINKEYQRIIAFLGWFIFSLFQPLGVVHWVFLILIFDL